MHQTIDSILYQKSNSKDFQQFIRGDKLGTVEVCQLCVKPHCIHHVCTEVPKIPL